jgi:hypothetical protein
MFSSVSFDRYRFFTITIWRKKIFQLLICIYQYILTAYALDRGNKIGVCILTFTISYTLNDKIDLCRWITFQYFLTKDVDQL